MWQQPQRLIITNPSPSLVPALNGTTVSVESTSNPANCLLKQKSSMENLINRRLEEPSRPWIQSAPKGLVDSVSIQERKRQEAINEVIYTECNFVRDLEYLRNCWMEPLKSRDIIPLDRRSGFVREVFWNVEEILDVNSHLRDRLIKRQIGHSIVDTIGDIFLETVPYFQPFIQYGKHQLYGKCEFEKEKSSNPAFAVFVEMVERLPESRKLELNVYLTKPIMRLVQYLLMLESVLKHTPEKNSDRSAIPKVLKMIREYLAKVNEERRRTENSFKLLQPDKALVFRPGVQVELGLRNEQRELLHHSLLECHEGTSNTIGRLHVFLLDHVLLMVQTKMVKKHEQLEVFTRPIPLELLVVSILDEDSRQQTKSRKWFFRRSHDRRASNGAPPPPVTPTKSGYQLRVWYLGRNGYTLTLGAPTIAERDKWLEKTMARQEAIGDRSGIFNTHILNTGVFLDKTKVNCAVSYGQ
ncbi:hypothetical protein OPQ81_007976 [Rhizoctonia solani]|nr:hypothetical protein OPQ81_007976 [Rhizoctonia solani]